MGARSQIIVLVLAICLGAGLFIVFFKPGARTAYDEPFAVQNDSNSEPVVADSEVPAPSTGVAISGSGRLTEIPDEAGMSGQPEQHVLTRINELQRAARSDDPAALFFIVPDLSSGDPRIRRVALEAAVQFGSTNAIPALRDAYAQVDNPEEQLRIKGAIDFLALVE